MLTRDQRHAVEEAATILKNAQMYPAWRRQEARTGLLALLEANDAEAAAPDLDYHATYERAIRAEGAR